jgi:branched-subunit amino acid aminotransferase/4-amino-4-deoxychorismate lyase
MRPVGETFPPPLRARSVRYERDCPDVKHTGLFGSLYARRAAQLEGFDDVLFVGADGLVSEGGTWNVGFVGDDGVVWPKAAVLPGVTMTLLQRQVDHRVAPITLDQAKSMRAAFASNTSIGLRALSHLDDTPMAIEHPLLTMLCEVPLIPWRPNHGGSSCRVCSRAGGDLPVYLPGGSVEARRSWVPRSGIAQRRRRRP